MILVADSGSTKTSWCWGNERLDTIGINPVRDSEEQMASVIAKVPAEGVTELFFYGAGCIAPYAIPLQQLLQQHFPQAEVHVETDMLGAARALCGHHEGVACILGTGSNSCLYDGEQIVQNVSPLGYILGDEGSGAVLGRRLVGDLLKLQLGEDLRDEFFAKTGLTPAEIINRVYRQAMPNRFLASLVPFIAEHTGHTGIHALLIDEFRRFFRRNVALYGRADLSVNFVGGIANQFSDELRLAAEQEGFAVGVILSNPIDEMVRFHAQ